MTRPDARRILNFWEAMESVYPIPDPWQQMAILAHQLSKGHALAMAIAGQKWEVEPYTHFMPGKYKPLVAASERAQSPEVQTAVLDQVFGSF